ncbi:MAG TPA: hypothetical protein VF440_01155 [Novosphingobium sp.]
MTITRAVDHMPSTVGTLSEISAKAGDDVIAIVATASRSTQLLVMTSPKQPARAFIDRPLSGKPLLGLIVRNVGEGRR